MFHSIIKNILKGIRKFFLGNAAFASVLPAVKRMEVANLERSFVTALSLAENNREKEDLETNYAVERYLIEGDINVVFTPTVESFIKAYVVVRDAYWRGEIDAAEHRSRINNVFEEYGSLLVRLGVTTDIPDESFYEKYVDLLFAQEEKNFQPGDPCEPGSELYTRNCNETRPIGEKFCREYARTFKKAVDRIDIQDISELNSTTYKAEKKYGSNQIMEVEIGDEKQAEFYPRVKFKKWDNEVNFSIGVMDTPDGAVVNKVGNMVEWEKGNKKARFYPLDDGIPEAVEENLSQPEEGAFEFDLVITDPLTENFVDFSIETKGLKFYYQPPLTQQEIDAGCFRPVNIEGSYAVYHATKGNAHKVREAAEKYKVGKAFHIYRPKITDANGTEVWGDLSLDEQTGVLRVIIPQKFLDAAVYPIVVDPTFGYTTNGASSNSGNGTGTDRTYAGRFALSEDGDVTSITWRGNRSAKGSNSVTTGIYSDNSNYPDARQGAETGSQTVTTTQSWWTFTYGSAPSLTAANYWLTVFFPSSTASIWKYDSGGGGDYWMGYVNTQLVTGSAPATYPAGQNANTGRIYSIYATYTATGGGGPTTRRRWIGGFMSMKTTLIIAAAIGIFIAGMFSRSAIIPEDCTYSVFLEGERVCISQELGEYIEKVQKAENQSRNKTERVIKTQ